MAAFISFHAWHSVPGRQFAPSWTVCTNPPFSPTAAPYPVTIVLSPIRKDTTYRHWQQPLVTGFTEQSSRVLLQSSWSGGLTAATLEGQFWYLRSVKASYLRKKELVALDSGKRTTVGSGGFFVCRTWDYDATERISRSSLLYCYYPRDLTH